MIHDILIWPDPKLREAAAPVTRFDEALDTLVHDMFETMYAAKGVGLAAPQIGVGQRVVVIDTSPQDEGAQPLVLINPRITRAEGSRLWSEGCLSVPDEQEKVQRAEKVWVTALDQKGNEIAIEADGSLLALALQHELEHLEGGLFIDHLSTLKRGLIKRRMLRLKEKASTRKRG
ncbi:MAG: peptide deformylase [Myxococcales bacterium]|jgi:peptide deformylase|nr:peptide deformylase [Myxococcales bacterium]